MSTLTLEDVESARCKTSWIKTVCLHSGSNNDLSQQTHETVTPEELVRRGGEDANIETGAVTEEYHVA